MTELTPQEKLLKLQEMGKMPADDWFQNYVKLAQENAALLTMIKAANKIVEKRNSNWVWATPAKLATLNREKLELLALDFEKMLSNVEKALEVPRNREQNFLKPTVCAYKEDVPNCEVIDCNDCPHAMKPRKEKCRVGGVPQNVPSCKELESDEFHDCQGYTSKIVKKENKQK